MSPLRGRRLLKRVSPPQVQLAPPKRRPTASLLHPGESVALQSSGGQCVVEVLLGSGGQGEVYRARPEGNEPLALKWYYPHSATPEQRAALAELVEMGAPDGRFLWPLDLAEAAGVPGFGYLMPLRDGRFHGMVELVQRRLPWSIRTYATVALALADSYLRLHARGLCYRDISFGNVFMEPNTGSVLICDNDNVGIDGKESGILGTLPFMAPEIIRREAAPSTDTDLYSLAVLLFHIFMIDHPLLGAREVGFPCLDVPAMEQLFGWNPLFVFDPHDASNRPVAGIHDNAALFWQLYPQFLRDQFTQAFTEGIRDPEHGRVGETMWKKTMVKLRDSVVICPSCGAENCYERSAGSSPSTCWRCSATIPAPYRLDIAREAIVLNSDTKLYPHHLERRSYDFSSPLAVVSPHPQNASVWGLTNLSTSNWTAFDPGGVIHQVAPGRTIRLDDGVRIQFGRVDGYIRR